MLGQAVDYIVIIIAGTVAAVVLFWIFLYFFLSAVIRRGIDNSMLKYQVEESEEYHEKLLALERQKLQVMQVQAQLQSQAQARDQEREQTRDQSVNRPSSPPESPVWAAADSTRYRDRTASPQRQTGLDQQPQPQPPEQSGRHPLDQPAQDQPTQSAKTL